ncbi:MAG: SpoVA/SpoVAEb family sporulation membrane protein [Clostridia bacterium]|nr:SpoVA/SpoVAEb family sporulation membrane protein [Clostridia bacterium]
MDRKTYKRYAAARAKKSPSIVNCPRAFLVGGAICAFAQLLRDLYGLLGWEAKTVGMMTSATLIFLAVLLTGLGVFDKIAAFAGAGTLVPITGFANAVASPAIDARTEGFVLGVGAKIFTVAGPVILYGIGTGVLYGIVYATLRAAGIGG